MRRIDTYQGAAGFGTQPEFQKGVARVIRKTKLPTFWTSDLICEVSILIRFSQILVTLFDVRELRFLFPCFDPSALLLHHPQTTTTYYASGW
jgi:hypothetical protein